MFCSLILIGEKHPEPKKGEVDLFSMYFLSFFIDLTLSTLWKLKNLFRTNNLTHFQVVCHVSSSSLCVQRGERDLLVRGACACP